MLKDPEQALIIQDAYAEWIAPQLSDDTSKAFSQALLKVCFLFGSSQFSPEGALLASLKEENIEHKIQISEFCKKANVPARPNLTQRKDPQSYTIAILTTSASGGNHAVADAMKAHLDTTNNVNTIIVDVEELAKDADLVSLATGASTYDGLYTTLFQQENQGLELLGMRDELSKRIGKYIPSQLGLNLKQRMREIKPDLIISTRNYTVDDIPLSTLGVPYQMVHCDYELGMLLKDFYGKTQPEMVEYCLPTFAPRAFLPMFQKNNRMDLYNEQDSVETLMEKVALMTEQPLEDIKKQYQLLNYPVKPEFYRIKDLEPLRKKWGIQPNEAPILISMGKNGVGVLEAIFDELNTSAEQHPSHKYFIVCGKNTSLQEKLLRKAGKQFNILGLITHQEMNELMNLCPITISKAGGAIVSETYVTGTYLLMFDSHIWEDANASNTERANAGRRVEKLSDLLAHIEDCIKNPCNSERPAHDWQSQLVEQLKRKNIQVRIL